MTFYCRTNSNALFLRLESTDPLSVRLQPVKVLILDAGHVRMTGNGVVQLVSLDEFTKEWTSWEVEGGS
jgi:hypothetical protein